MNVDQALEGIKHAKAMARIADAEWLNYKTHKVSPMPARLRQRVHYWEKRIRYYEQQFDIIVGVKGAAVRDV